MNETTREPKTIRSVMDLDVYVLAYEAAMEIFRITQKFPPEEKYSLTDQIRRSSRSVAINIREGFAKRRYINLFTRLCTDALGSSEETRGWLCFSRDCGYIDAEISNRLDGSYDRINAMLFKLMEKWVAIEDHETLRSGV
jgi:four helix bundle protein